jgi:hypothetical protein
MSQPPPSSGTDTARAVHVAHEISLNARHPSPDWQTAPPITFCTDWQGQHPDPGRQTEVRLLWTPKMLYLRFECCYRQLCTFEDSDQSGRRDGLWDRDVAEVFLQPDSSLPRSYREFEVSPNGMWIDLDISPAGLSDLQSGLARAVDLDRQRHTWAAELAIPMKALTEHFDPVDVWGANFYRVEGPQEPRFYSAWRPTGTPQPNFHLPWKFGKLRFEER